MEEDEIQAQAISKFPRLGNGRNEPNKIGPRGGGVSEQQYPDEEEDIGDPRRGSDVVSTNRFHTWHHSSRIIRVSRASGGKDRHSKVMTSKGLRDRRVRLSVATAIQFYDLQDRLGYDQPSKAVEWLIKSASEAISELPSLNNTFPETPKQPSDEKRASVGTEQGFDSADAEIDGETNYQHQHQHQNNQSQNLSLSKSACSSTSETSKGSGLSLSRPDIRVNRVKARERARERTAKEKENESHNNIAHHHHNGNPISQTATFTELLTGGISNAVPTTTSPNGSVHQNHYHHHHGGGGDEANNPFNKAAAVRNQWCSSAPMDYFTSGLLGPSSSSRTNHHNQSSSGFSQIQLGNPLNPEAMSVSPFSISGDHHHQHNQNNSSDQLQHHFSFIPDHLMPAVVTSSSSQPSGSTDYNLNFTISSSGLAGYNNRGTLQSNSQSHILPHHHLHQRFSSSPIDGSTVPFFIGAAAASAAAAPPPTMENNHHHHQFSTIFDGRLQLCYGDHSDQKGKAKN